MTTTSTQMATAYVAADGCIRSEKNAQGHVVWRSPDRLIPCEVEHSVFDLGVKCRWVPAAAKPEPPERKRKPLRETQR